MKPSAAPTEDQRRLSGPEIDDELRRIQRSELVFHGQLTIRFAYDLVQELKNRAPGVVDERLRQLKLSHEAFRKMYRLEDDMEVHIFGEEFHLHRVHGGSRGLTGSLHRPGDNGNGEPAPPKERSVYAGPNETLHPLSVEPRNRIGALLAKGETNMSNAVEVTGMDFVTVKKHLEAMVANGLAAMRQRGRSKMYRLAGMALPADADVQQDPPSNGDVPAANVERPPYVGEEEHLNARGLETRKRIFDSLSDTPQSLFDIGAALEISEVNVGLHMQRLVRCGVAIATPKNKRQFLYTRAPAGTPVNPNAEPKGDAPAETVDEHAAPSPEPETPPTLAITEPDQSDVTQPQLDVTTISVEVDPTPYQQPEEEAPTLRISPASVEEEGERAMIPDPEDKDSRIERLERRILELEASHALIRGEVAELREQVETLLAGKKIAQPARNAPTPVHRGPYRSPATAPTPPPAPAPVVPPTVRPSAPRFEVSTTPRESVSAAPAMLPSRLYEGIDPRDSHKHAVRLAIYRHLTQHKNGSAWAIGLAVGKTTAAVQQHLDAMVAAGVARILDGSGAQATYAVDPTAPMTSVVAAPRPPAPAPSPKPAAPVVPPRAPAPVAPSAAPKNPSPAAPAPAPSAAITILARKEIDETGLTKAGRIVALIARKGEATMEEIIQHLSCSPLTASKYRDVVVKAGFVTHRLEGLKKIYRLQGDPAAIDAFLETDRATPAAKPGPKSKGRPAAGEGTDDDGAGADDANDEDDVDDEPDDDEGEDDDSEGAENDTGPNEPDGGAMPAKRRGRPAGSGRTLQQDPERSYTDAQSSGTPKRRRAATSDTGSMPHFVGRIEDAVNKIDPVKHANAAFAKLQDELPMEKREVLLTALRTMQTMKGEKKQTAEFTAFYDALAAQHPELTRHMLIQWSLQGDKAIAWLEDSEDEKVVRQKPSKDDGEGAPSGVARLKPRCRKHPFTLSPFDTPTDMEQRIIEKQLQLPPGAEQPVRDALFELDFNLTMQEWDDYAVLADSAEKGDAKPADLQKFLPLFRKAFPFIPQGDAELIASIMFSPNRALALDAELKQLIATHLTFS